MAAPLAFDVAPGAGVDAGTGRARRLGRRLLVALAALHLLGNVGFAVAAGRAGGEPLLAAAAGQSERVVLVAPAGNGRALVATRENEVTLRADGEPIAEALFPSVVTALAGAPDGSEVSVGTADGTVTILDAALSPLRTLPFEGRVVGLAASAAGLFVGHGVGAFGDRYFVGHVPPGAGEAATSVQVGFPITALDALGDGAVFGTDDARVGLVEPGAAAPTWETTLRGPLTRVLGVPDEALVLAGTDGGDLALLDADGALRWTTSIGPYPVRGLAFDPASGTAFAGDSRGNLVAVGADGGVRLTRSVADADLEAIVPGAEAGALLAIPREGNWQTLNATALDAARLGGRVRVAWFGFNAVLIAAAFAAAVAAVDRWRLAVGRQAFAVRRAKIAYAFLLPAIGLILLFSYYPAALAFYYSLTNFSLRSVTEFVGLENYRGVLFDDRYFRIGLLNMVIIVGTSILKTITVPLLVAELVFWLRNGVHQYLFRTLFVLPAVVPDLVFTLMWRQVYDPNTGLLNQLLGTMGLGQFRRAWLGDEDTAIWAIVGVGFPFVSAFAFLIFIGGLLNINGEYFDAAKVDGARWYQRFLHMDLPLLRPQFRVLLFFAVVGAIQGFAGVFILTRGGPGTATYVPALQMYLRIAEGDFGYASAVGVVLFVLVMLLTVAILRFRRNEGAEGA